MRGNTRTAARAHAAFFVPFGDGAANAGTAKQRRPAEVARFLRKFETKDRLEVCNALLSIGLHHFQQMTGGEANLAQLLHTTAQIRRLPSFHFANAAGRDGRAQESGGGGGHHLPLRAAATVGFGAQRSSSAPARPRFCFGGGKHGDRGRSSSAGLRQFLEEERVKMRDAAHVQSPTVTVRDKPGRRPAAERLHDGPTLQRTAAPPASERRNDDDDMASILHAPAAPAAPTATAATAALCGGLEQRTTSLLDDGMHSRQPSSPMTSSSPSRSATTAMDAIVASACPDLSGADGALLFPASFIDDLQRVVRAMNGTRVSPLIVAAHLTKDHANLTARRGFAELYRSVLINYHIAAATMAAPHASA